MSIPIHPDIGDVFICDFSQINTKDPEMIKRRPVINLTPRRRPGRLCTVIPLSTTAPTSIQTWHCKLHLDLPEPYNSPEMWVKADMLYTLSLDRFFLFRKGKDKNDKRIYTFPQLTEDQLEKVYRCILKGLSLHNLANSDIKL